MTPLRFTCKKTKNIYTEVFGEGQCCDRCAFGINSEFGLESYYIPTLVPTSHHCVAMPCAMHKSYFVKVESDAENV